MLTEAGKNCKKLADLKCERSLKHSVHLFLVLFQVFVATFCYFCISFVPIQYSPNLGGRGGCRYFFDGTYADFSKFLKITTHPPPSRME